MERIVEVYNDRLDRWEIEKLKNLVDKSRSKCYSLIQAKPDVTPSNLGVFKIRIPSTCRSLWILVADDQTLDRQLVLITNVPFTSVSVVQQAYNDWRLRTRIEHGYRFDQEQGLDVEDMCAQTIRHYRK